MSQSIHTRIAQWRDIASLVNIYNQAVVCGQKTADTEPVTIDSRKLWFTEHSADKHPILVAEYDNLVVGYATISPYRPGRQAVRFTAEISYYVHFEYHRRGIAGLLLQQALDLCPTLQIKTLFAILIDTNHASIRLLKKQGFEQWGHLPRVAEYAGVEVGHLYYGLRIQS